MKKHTLKSLALSAVMAVTSVSGVTVATMATAHASGGVPTVDWLNIREQKNQYEQLIAQVKAVTQGENFMDLYNNPLIQEEINKYLPSQYKNIAEAVVAKDTRAIRNISEKMMRDELYKKTSKSALARSIVAQIEYDTANRVGLELIDVELQKINRMANNMYRTNNLAQKQDMANTIQASTANMNAQIAKIQIGIQMAKEEQERSRKILGAEMLKQQQQNSKKMFSSLFW